MNRGVLQSSPVQQMMAGNNPEWWSAVNAMRPLPIHQQEPISPSLRTLSMPLPLAFFPQFIPTSTSSSSSWHDNQDLPESWSQLPMGGLMGEEERGTIVYGHANEDFHHHQETKAAAEASNWSTAHQIMAAASSPKSCITTTATTCFSNNMLDFSGNKQDGRQPLPLDRSSECNSSTATGGALKKTRVQVQHSATQSTFKVRKEKLGDRITTLHQLVSPFGKTDTASVLLEAIGYIRFLQSQIEALSIPYLGSGSSGNMRLQQSLLEENCMKKRKGGPDQQDSNEEPNKDLKNRGLCLVPVSCTLQVGNDNGADYWALPHGGGFQ